MGDAAAELESPAADGPSAAGTSSVRMGRADAGDGRPTAPPPGNGGAGAAAGDAAVERGEAPEGDRERPVRSPAPTASPTPEPAPSGAGEAARPEAVLRATSRAYEGLRTLRADFEQELENALLGRTTRSEGTIYQKQPDLFLMRFSDPSGDVILSDGDWFWMYFPSVDEKQVLRTARGGRGLDLRTQFIGDPVTRFDITDHGPETVRGRPARVLTLDPREPLGYERLKVWIDTADHLVRRFELTETSGNVRRFELRNLERNPRLPDDLFEFTPPPGAQVVTR